MPSRGPKNETPDFGNSDFVVVANRLPVDAERQPDGSVTWKRSPGGLVTALEPLLRKQRGAWLGWPGIVDSPDAPVEPIVEEGLQLFPVPLTETDVAEYYEGLLQRHPVPLYHDVMVKPIYHREWWDRYVEVNRRFAEETSRAAAEGATVWVQDYQLQLVPKMLRMLRPDLTIGFFLHIPFPRSSCSCSSRGAPRSSKDSSARTWWDFTCRAAQRTSLSVPTAGGCAHLARVGGCPLPDGRSSSRLPHGQSGRLPDLHRFRRTRSARPQSRHPAARKGNPDRTRQSPQDPSRRRQARLHQGHRRATLKAFTELLEENRVKGHDAVFVQLATPAGNESTATGKCCNEIEQQVGHINGEFSEVGHPVLHYLHRPIPRDELIAFFVAADVMLVTPLRDGMNLVAKEYVACRSDLGGALVLSEFTGAAAELRQAYLTNPHDLEGVKDTIEAALNQSEEEGRRRMRSLRRQVLAHDVDRWARAFLDALAHTKSAD